MKTRKGGFFSFLISPNITAKNPQIFPLPHSKIFSPYLIFIALIISTMIEKSKNSHSNNLLDLTRLIFIGHDYKEWKLNNLTIVWTFQK